MIPVHAIAVHLIGGIWGTLAVALFIHRESLATDSRLEQFMVQGIGVFACGAWIFIAMYIFIFILNKIQKIRVTPEEEEMGLNIVEHGTSTELYDFYRILSREEGKREETTYTELGTLAKNYKDRLERDLRARTRSLQDFLRLTEQGFLSFSKDLIIEEGYSTQCQRIFGKKSLEGEDISHLIYSEYPMKQKDFQDSCDLFFQGNTSSEVAFKLIDQSVIINKKEVALDFLEVDANRVLCIMTDMTAKRELEQKVKASEEYQDKLLRAVSNNKYFNRFYENTQHLFSVYKRSLAEKEFLGQKKNIESLVLFTHDLKANMGFFGFDKTMVLAHDLETFFIDRGKNQGGALDLETLEEKTRNLQQQFESELDFFKENLGNEWFQSFKSLSVPMRLATELEKKVRQDYPDDKELLKKVTDLRMKPVSDYLNRFPSLVEETANMLGKKINPLIIKGGDTLIPAQNFLSLINVFPHVIRNMVVHGIEAPEERRAQNKHEAGNLELRIKEVEDDKQSAGPCYVFTFADDGQGIDIEKIKHILIKKNILQIDVNRLPDEKIVQYILKQIFRQRRIPRLLQVEAQGLLV